MKALKVIGVVSIVSLLVIGLVFFIFFGLDHKLAWLFQGVIMLLTASVFICFGIVIGKLGIDKFRRSF